jgi:hypothetical protein
VIVLLRWWFAPFSPLIGSFNFVAFDFSGPVLIASTVLCLAVGILVGTLTRQTAIAAFLALALIVGIRIGVEYNWRPNYEPQITVHWPLKTLNDSPPITLNIQDWNLGQGWIDGQGNKTNTIRCTATSAQNGTESPLQCAQAAGYRANYFS